MKLSRKPKDERITAQMGKIYKVGFWILGIGLAIDVYLQESAQMLLATGVVEVRLNEVIIFLAGFLYVCIQMVRKGIFDDDLRYADTETFPVGYGLKLSVIGSLAAGVLLVGGRIYNEIVYNGLSQVTWLGDAAMFLVFTVSLFGLIYVAEYLTWRIAKTRRDRTDGESR